MISVVTDSLSGELVIVSTKDKSETKRLSKQHARILRMMAMDVPISDIGRALSLCEASVAEHIKKICESFETDCHQELRTMVERLDVFESV